MTASSVPPAPAFDARQHLAGLLRAALASVAPSHGAVDIVLERPKQASHCDFASNLAMQLARELKTNPRQIAERLLRELPPLAAGRRPRTRMDRPLGAAPARHLHGPRERGSHARRHPVTLAPGSPL